MKISVDDLPEGLWLGRYNLAKTVHLCTGEPFTGPLCGTSHTQIWSLIDDGDARTLCSKCARILKERTNGGRS